MDRHPGSGPVRRSVVRARTPSVRPLVGSDLAEVGGLMHRHALDRPLHGGDTVAFLRATTVDHPWADREVPSLVACDDAGAVVGFIAVQARRFRFDGDELRAACISHFVVAPGSRADGTPMALLRRALEGAQELTYSDSATDVVSRMWRVLGGHVDHARRCDWALALAPVRWTRAVARSVVRRQVGRELVPVPALPFQMVGDRLLRRAFPPVDEGLDVSPVDADELALHIGATHRRTRLHAAYDADFLSSVFRVIGLAGTAPRACLVRRGEKVVGAFVYRPAAGTARVLTLSAAPGQTGPVLGALVRDAGEQGCGMLSGRLEPHLSDALAPRLPALTLARRPLIHSRRADVRDVMLSDRAVVSRLDSEWWVT